MDRESKLRGIYYILTVCLVLTGCSKDNPLIATNTGTISGLITNADNNAALPGVFLTISPGTNTTTTDANGKYTIANLSPGNYKVTAYKNYYGKKSTSVTVVVDRTVTANIALMAFVMEMIDVPSGDFLMGSTTSDPGYYSDELPQHLVTLNAYKIGKYEVTNGQYNVFIDAGGYSDSTYWSVEGWVWRKDHNITEPGYWSTGEYNAGPAFPNHPVVCISKYEAYAFCQWAGGRLPTEAEWEKAARGTDAQYYPWGNIWDAAKCNSCYNASPDTFVYSSPVGFFSLDISPCGAYDMAGNVLEWVNDLYQSAYYSISPTVNPCGPATGDFLSRGGSWYDLRYSYQYGTARRFVPPVNASYCLGFRLAM